MADSPRWCSFCQRWGDHHLDRCSFARAVERANARIENAHEEVSCPKCGAPVGVKYRPDVAAADPVRSS